MVLTSAEIASKAIVQNAVQTALRATTYDATVGCIIRGGSVIQDASYTLPPRGIVWVVSAETFRLPVDVTGLATLRTTWTHDGVLALNVGVVDPGWDGPLAAALVNFGNSDFVIKKGDPFFRVLFLGHNHTTAPIITRDVTTYTNMIINKSRMFSNTFLNMDALVSEVSDRVLKLPKWAYILTMLGILLSLIAIFAPIAISVWTDYRIGKDKLEYMQMQIADLKNDRKNEDKILSLQQQINNMQSAKSRTIKK